MDPLGSSCSSNRQEVAGVPERPGMEPDPYWTIDEQLGEVRLWNENWTLRLLAHTTDEPYRRGRSELPSRDGVYLAHENCPATFTKRNAEWSQLAAHWFAGVLAGKRWAAYGCRHDGLQMERFSKTRMVSSVGRTAAVNE